MPADEGWQSKDAALRMLGFEGNPIAGGDKARECEQPEQKVLTRVVWMAGQPETPRRRARKAQANGPAFFERLLEGERKAH